MPCRLFRCAAVGLALLVALPVATLRSPPAEAHRPGNWTRAERSSYCSTRAERHANRQTRRTTAAGALTGATVGNIAGNSRRATGRGALVGGSAGLLHSNSRWRTQYDRYYRDCMRW